MSESMHDRGARTLSVFGPFGGRTLVEMPTSLAVELFPDGGIVGASRSEALESVERDLAVIAKRDEGLAQSALAATARAMALELENPYNSATSKSMCARALLDALKGLRELAPPEQKKDDLDELRERRAAERARRAAAQDQPGPAG